MKCDYALKHMYSDTISVKLKQEIDEHISGCLSCRSNIAASEQVGETLAALEPVRKDSAFWSDMSRGVRLYRENRQKKWWHTILDFLQVEPVSRRSALIGGICCLILFMVVAVYIPTATDNRQAADDVAEEVDFYLQEHTLAQDADIFGIGAFNKVFVSAMNPSKDIYIHKN